MKTFILLSAVPGAGKSTWAEQYRLTHDNVYVVSSDGIRKELSGVYQNFEHEEDVWKIFFKRIHEYRDLADDVTVIADSTNIYNRHRQMYGEKVEGFDKKIMVEIIRPLEVLLKQNQERMKGRIVIEDVVKRMYRDYEKPTPEVINLYDEYIVIDGDFDASKVDKSFHYK